MVDASSSGRVAPKIKSIDVRANLLSQRLAEREQLFQAARGRLYIIVATVVSGAVLLPWLYGIQAKAATGAAVVVNERDRLQKEVTELQSQADLIGPKVRQLEMSTKCQVRAKGFVREFVSIMNAVSPDIALSSLKGEVVGGELKLTARADAETFASVESYVRLAAQGAPPKDSGITSTKRSDTLRKAGINFEFTKKVQVGGS